MKRTFKDFYKKDIDSVFFNENEFSEKVTIDGKEVLVNVDNETLNVHNSKSGGEGLIFNGFIFYIKIEDMPFIPHPGQDIFFDGVLYYIADVKKQLSIYSITLEVRDS